MKHGILEEDYTFVKMRQFPIFVCLALAEVLPFTYMKFPAEIRLKLFHFHSCLFCIAVITASSIIGIL